MNEDRRKRIVKIIDEDLKRRNSLEEKKKELEELSRKPEVIAHLKLQESINQIQRNIESYKDAYGNVDDSIEKRANRAFRNNIYRGECTHDLWLYEGTYYECEDFLGNTHYTNVKPHNKKVTGFAYKKYACIECGKEEKTTENEKFEATHNVLIDEEQIFQLKYYQDMYYQLLFQGLTSKEAYQELKIEFENNKNHPRKIKYLKQGK